MDDMKYVVYCHTLKGDGRKYIGITSQKPEYRWNNGRGYTKENHHSHFANAVRKYGWDNFIHEILYENLSRTEAQDKEIELIKKYNTRNRKYGFNTQIGGDLGSLGLIQTKETINKRKAKLIGQKRSEETKKRISEWHKNAPKEYRESLSRAFKGRVVSEETRRKISERTRQAMNNPEVKAKVSKGGKGRIPWNKGKPWSDEVKLKMSNGKKGVPHPEFAKSVVCIETGEVYSSVKEASLQFNPKGYTGNICACCKGKRKTAYGFSWKYAESEVGKNVARE